MTHLAEGLCPNALLTLKVQNSLICLLGTIIIIITITIMSCDHCSVLWIVNKGDW
jgi:hypothetical protein